MANGFNTVLAATAPAVLALACLWSGPASAQAIAGERIRNVASISYTVDGETRTIDSNTVETRVDERLDVGVTAATASVGVGADTQQVLRFQIINHGNGNESFALAAGNDGSLAVGIVGLAFDTDGDGVYDPAHDVVYSPGANDPILAPGASVTVFVICSIPANAAEGQTSTVTLTATAVTGSGEPGDTFEGEGDAGGAAVVGTTTAEDADPTLLTVVASGVQFTKSQIVTDAAGGAAPVPGAIVTYTLSVRAFGATSITDAVVTDPIPAGAAYVPGTLTLDGAVLTDAADSDAGAFDGVAINVNLGVLTAPAERLVTFKARIE